MVPSHTRPVDELARTGAGGLRPGRASGGLASAQERAECRRLLGDPLNCGQQALGHWSELLNAGACVVLLNV